MLDRPSYRQKLRAAINRSPITALLGPRQCGKTTLARSLAGEFSSTFFDLESPRDMQRLQNPELTLRTCSGLVIIDEIQLAPSLFPVLRVLADRPDTDTRFLILGSASPQLMSNASESLAGRVEFVDLSGFLLSETGVGHMSELWVRGSFPRSFLAASDEDSCVWRESFIRTFLQQDLPQLGIRIPAPQMRRFWTMLAHYHGQTWNASELSRSLGQSDKTIRSYLDILTDSYMIRQLQPWHENLKKRQVKAPKIYFRDTGLLHSLLMLQDYDQLNGHPRVGASWEGFALEQVIAITETTAPYFWSTHSGPEVDLLLFHQGKRHGIEFKYSEAPTVTVSMRSAIKCLGLDRLWIVTPVDTVYDLDSHISVCGLQNFQEQWEGGKS